MTIRITYIVTLFFIKIKYIFFPNSHYSLCSGILVLYFCKKQLFTVMILITSQYCNAVVSNSTRVKNTIGKL